MKNKELFVLNPDENNLINDGVAQLNTSSRDREGQQIIRHEIRTFVCEGEYESGLRRVLQTYLSHFEQPKQPAAWVSGFFGSGKSHLVKMLSYFWENFSFDDGITARELKPLPDDLQEQFVELSRLQKQHGSVVVRGLLSEYPAKQVHYSFLQLMLSNLQLPSKLHQFRFWYWCRSEGILDDLISHIESAGKKFEEELNNLYVSKHIPAAIMKLMPDYAESEAQVRDQIGRNFPRVDNLSREEFLFTIKSQILPMYSDSLPCILVTLDEVQQFIASDEDKSHQVQLLAEDLCGNFSGRLLLVGTGQNALTDTPILQKLNERFTVKVPLTDKDVETVTRKTVLEKKSSAASHIDQTLARSLGEVSRLLEGSDFGFTQEDKKTLVADYPILPSTRKFWKRVLQAIDVAGTSGQLRSQLRIVDESIKSVADRNLGEVIPADFIFEQKKQQLIQNALLLNEQSNIMESLAANGGDDALKARILAVAFLIDLLPRDTNRFQLKADSRTIADLLIDSIEEPSDTFRTRIENLIEDLVQKDKYLIPLDDEFKLQTRVGAEWEKEFTTQASKFRNDEQRLYEVRMTRIRSFLEDKLRSVFVLQGDSKQRREPVLHTGQEKPRIGSKLNLWIRDGWLENEATLLDEIRAEGTDQAIGYIFIRKNRDHELMREIVKMLAAQAALAEKGIPSTPDGDLARKSMETRKKMAEQQVLSLTESVCQDIKVYLAGGASVDGGDMTANIRQALTSLASRQFPEFRKADYPAWDKALRKAANNDTQALSAIGFKKDLKDHPMTAELIKAIGFSGKTGKDIRETFTKTPYGWSQDAIDAMLISLKLAGNLSTNEANLNQRSIAQAVFKVEAMTLSGTQKVQIRSLFSKANVHCQPGNELKCSVDYLRMLDILARNIAGDPPRPESVENEIITELLNLEGNERLLAIHEQADTLQSCYEQWTREAAIVRDRLPSWELLLRLDHFAEDSPEIKEIRNEISAIEQQRMLLREPDPIQTPLSRLADHLRSALNEHKKQYNEIYQQQMTSLQQNEYFRKLEPEEKHDILTKHKLLKEAEIASYSPKELLRELNHASLDAWSDKVAALPSKFQQALEEAIELSAPQAESYSLPRRTIRSEADLEKYLSDVRASIKDLLTQGDVILK